MLAKYFICSVSKTYIQQAKASVRGLDFNPCFTAAVIHVSPQSIFAFFPSCLCEWRKGEHGCSVLPRGVKDKMLNWLSVKISHDPWCKSPLEKHRWKGANSTRWPVLLPLRKAGAALSDGRWEHSIHSLFSGLSTWCKLKSCITNCEELPKAQDTYHKSSLAPALASQLETWLFSWQ